jgi:RNA polymerase sigma-70 factor (sigma-E family)
MMVRVSERTEHVESSRLGELYRLHAPAGKRLAFLLTGDVHLAEDLVQEAFVRIVGRLVHLRNDEAFPAYMRKTIVNLARMHFRRRRVERDRSEPSPMVSAPAPEETESLRRALLALPYRQRAALVLRYYVDLPDEEAASMLGCARGTIRSLVARGSEALREQLEGG